MMIIMNTIEMKEWKKKKQVANKINLDDPVGCQKKHFKNII